MVLLIAKYTVWHDAMRNSPRNPRNPGNPNQLHGYVGQQQEI